MEGALVNKAGETSCPPGVYILLGDNVKSAMDEYKGNAREGATRVV